MAARVKVFIATSLDGFIAGEDGDLAWLPAPREGEDHGYSAFMDGIDQVVMGRSTYEAVRAFGIPWPYTKPVVVLSTTLHAVEGPRVSLMAGEPAEILAALPGQRIYLDGGETIRRFLAAGLVDELTITSIPVVLGAGVPLFGPAVRGLRLRAAEARVFSDGLVQVRYEVDRS